MINVAKLHRELTAAGLSIVGVSTDEHDNFDRIDFAPGVTALQRQKAAQIVAAHDPTDTDALRRQAARAAYTQLTALRGMTPDQAETWVQANVTDLTSAKDAMKLIARMLVILARAGDLEDG